jgi:hypothetical protein
MPPSSEPAIGPVGQVFSESQQDGLDESRGGSARQGDNNFIEKRLADPIYGVSLLQLQQYVGQWL